MRDPFLCCCSLCPNQGVVSPLLALALRGLEYVIPYPPGAAKPREVTSLEGSVRHAAALSLLSLAKTCPQDVLRAAPDTFETLRRISQDTANALFPSDRLVVLETVLVLSSSLPPADQWVGGLRIVSMASRILLHCGWCH